MGWMDSFKSVKDGTNLPEDERERIAKDLVTMSSFGAAAVTYAPIPLSDFFLVTPVQAGMVMSVGRVYGRKLEMGEAKEILLELLGVCGVGMVAQKGFATLSKILLPGFGGLLAGPYAFAVTYGLGNVAMRYFETGGAPREVLKGVYERAVNEGKKVFSKEKLDEFRKRRGKDVEDFAKAEAAEPKRSTSRAPKKSTAKKKPARRPAQR
jgi:uncharacterized protein (DUF697 family)